MTLIHLIVSKLVANNISRNQFEALEIEELDDEYPVTAAEISTPGPKAGSERDIYELDENDADFEATFRLYCFFEDLHKIQAEIQKVWQHFADGKIGLKTATVVTEAGIDMVKRLEEQQPSRESSCEHHGSKHPHINLALPVFYADALMAGEDPDELLNTTKSLEHREFYDFIYLPTARTLMKFADIAHQVGDKVAWPFPVMPMRFSYIVRPDLLELPEYKKLEDDDQLLTQMLLDMFLIQDFKKMMQQNHASDGGSLPDLQDEFAKSARPLWQKGTVSTYSVFTSRIVLDILDICGGSSQAQFASQLREEGKIVEKIMNFYTNINGMRSTRGARWLAKDNRLIDEIHQLATLHIPGLAVSRLKGTFLDRYSQQLKGGSIEDMPPDAQAALRERMIEQGMDPDEEPTEEHNLNAEKLELSPIEPSRQKDFLQTHNALHSGNLSLALTSKMEEAGIALANHHMSIFAMAHLYNAFQQLGATEIKWPGMDRIIDLHVNPLFANAIPKTPSECQRRIAYRTNATGIDRNFERKQPWKLRAGAASASLRQLLENSNSIEHALLQLEAQIEEHATSQLPFRKKKNNISSRGRTRQLNPSQIMSRFQQYLPIVLQDMELDYITLTKTCNALLKTIRSTLRDELGLWIPSSQQSEDSYDHSIITVVQLILDADQKSAAAHMRRRDVSVFRGGAEMRTACRAFEVFFNSYIVPPSPASHG